MLRARRTRLTGLSGVLAAGALLAGCSQPAPPAVVPTPTVTAAPTPTVPTPSTPATSPTATSAAPSSAAPPPPSPSSDGTIDPSRPVETAPPKKLDEPTKTAGAQVSLVSVKTTTIKASTPGDSSGPGVVVRLRMVNTTGKTLDTSFVQVNVNNDAGDPATSVVGAPSDPITGSLKVGRSATGTYAFLLDDARTAPVTVAVYVTSGQPVVTFRGRAS